MNEPVLVREEVGGEIYEYYPLGQYVVRAPGVCGGRPTFKYTRVDVQHALELLGGGRSVDEVAAAYRLSPAAVQEAVSLATQALLRQAV